MSKVIEKFQSLLATSQSLAQKYGKSSEYDILKRLLEDVQRHKLSLLVCGEFKRGKSSLINALLKQDICPVADGIATSAVSIIKYGEKPKITRYYSVLSDNMENPSSGEEGRVSIHTEVIPLDSIEQFAKGSTIDIDNTIYLEIEIPSEILSNGLILIDTPGIGSLDPRHLFLTMKALPKADAFLFVTDTSEPLLTTEIDFIKEKICSTTKPFDVILAKSDLLDKDGLNVMKQDTESKIYEKTGVKANCIPVSSTEWAEYNKMGNERREKNSNCREVLAAIEAFYTRREKYIEELFREKYVGFLSSIKIDIEKAIEDLSSDNVTCEKESYVQQLEELKALREMIMNNDSEFRTKINSIIELSQEKVFSDFSRESVILSSEKLENILNDPHAAEKDGERFVTKKVNDAMTAMSKDIDEQIDKAILEVVDELTAYIEDFHIKGGTVVIGVDCNISPVMHTFAEKFVGVTRQSLPFIGISSLAGGLTAGVLTGIGAATTAFFMPIVGVVGMAAGIFYVVQSIKGTRKQESVNNIRKQLTPRINIAMNELRAYIQKRYNEFNKEVVKALKATANGLAEQMKEKVRLIQECENDSKKRAVAVKELQQQLTMVENLITQTSVLNTNPFARK